MGRLRAERCERGGSARQALKEDLAQFRLSASDLLDLGWYPSFDPDGHFVVLVVTDGVWEQPAFRGEAATWSELRALIREGLATADQGGSYSRPRTERRMMSYDVTHLIQSPGSCGFDTPTGKPICLR